LLCVPSITPPKVAQHDITITTYEMVILEKGFFAKQKWKYIYIDEAHRIKVRMQGIARSLNRQPPVRLAQPPISRLSAHLCAHVVCLSVCFQNENSLLSRVVRSFNSEHRLLITGTRQSATQRVELIEGGRGRAVMRAHTHIVLLRPLFLLFV